MLNNNDKRKRGRPISGTEQRGVYRGMRLEKSLDDEFVYACRTLGVSITEGLRQGVILFIQYVRKRYY